MKTQILLSFLAIGLFAASVEGGECCGNADCGKICKLVCTTKTVEVTCYGYECEDYCIPCPSGRGEKRCESAGKCDLFCCLHWTEWCPTGAKMSQRKKLTKYVATREVPSYKWVVVPACQADSAAGGDVVKAAPRNARLGDQYAVGNDELPPQSAQRR